MNLRISQSFRGGQSQVISLRQTIMYAYNNKIDNIRVKIKEQIHCEFLINPSQLHKNTNYIPGHTLMTNSNPNYLPKGPPKNNITSGIRVSTSVWSKGNKYSGHSGVWEFPRTKSRHRFPNGKHLLMNKLNFENHFKGLIMWWNIKNSIKSKNKIIKTTRSKTPETSLCLQRSLESKLWFFQ